MSKLGLHRLDGLERVLSRAHHDDAARHFAFAVELRNTAAEFWTELKTRHIAEAHRDARGTGTHRDASEVVEVTQVTRCSYDIFRFRKLEHRTTRFLVRAAYRLDHLALRDPVRQQSIRLQHYLVLADNAAERCDLGDVRHCLQLVFQEPVLDRPQLRQIVSTASIDERVLVDPTDTRGIGSQRRLCVRWQAALHLVQVLEHARARPVQVRAVLEQHVDERITEERVAADGLCSGHRQHRGRERVGDLVLDDARRLAGEGRADDHLHVRQIGQRVEGRAEHGPHAPGRHDQRREHDQEAVLERPAYEPRDHGEDPVGGLDSLPVVKRVRAALRLASESIRN